MARPVSFAAVGFVIRRNAARVVCFDPAGRILMIRSSDPADRNKPHWWELPGGGIDGRERAEHAIARELAEEAGVTEVTVGPCVWTQRARFRFAGWDFDQAERIHVARCDGTTDGVRHLEAFEALAFEESRWWEPAELLADAAPTVPPRLREFLPAILDDLAAGRLDIGAGADAEVPTVDITPLD